MWFVDFIPEAQLSNEGDDLKRNWQIFGLVLYEADMEVLITDFSNGHHVHFFFDQDNVLIHKK